MSRKNERTGQDEEEEDDEEGEEDRPLFWHDNNKSLQAGGIYQLQEKIKNE